jgi:hypothetical protein
VVEGLNTNRRNTSRLAKKNKEVDIIDSGWGMGDGDRAGTHDNSKVWSPRNSQLSLAVLEEEPKMQKQQDKPQPISTRILYKREQRLISYILGILVGLTCKRISNSASTIITQTSFPLQLQ